MFALKAASKTVSRFVKQPTLRQVKEAVESNFANFNAGNGDTTAIPICHRRLPLKTDHRPRRASGVSVVNGG